MFLFMSVFILPNPNLMLSLVTTCSKCYSLKDNKESSASWCLQEKTISQRAGISCATAKNNLQIWSWEILTRSHTWAVPSAPRFLGGKWILMWLWVQPYGSSLCTASRLSYCLCAQTPTALSFFLILVFFSLHGPASPLPLSQQLTRSEYLSHVHPPSLWLFCSISQTLEFRERWFWCCHFCLHGTAVIIRWAVNPQWVETCGNDS